MATSGETKSSESAKPPAPARRVQSTELLGRGRELVIVHQNEEYRLRVTRNGKLILTK